MGDLRVILYVIALLFILRLGLHVWLRAGFHDHVDAATVILALAQGLRFDVQMATVSLLPSVALSLLTVFGFGLARLRHAVRVTIWTIIAWSSVLLMVIDGFYFKEFGSQFDPRLFEPLNEDLGALLATIWASYPVVWIALGSVAFGVAVWWSSRWVVRNEERQLACWSTVRVVSRGVALVLVIGGFVVAARGSITHRPLQSGTAAVTTDRNLNRLIPSPWHALRVALLDHWQTRAAERDGGRAFDDINLSVACRQVFDTAADRDLDQATLRFAHGAASTPPRHIVLVLMESESGWVLMDGHRSLGLAPHLAWLGEHGVTVPRFVSAGSGTLYSLGPLFTGIPDCGVMQSLTPTTRAPFPTSLAPIFRKLGYRTRFFYGGYLASKRYGDFALDQGFEEVFGQQSVTATRTNNSWGVDDADLFAMVARTLDDRQPSLSVILTTSNHPPYEVDLASAGFDAQQLAAESGISDPETLRVLGHLWYNDHCVGAFVTALESRLPGLLVAITGDHYGRRFINGTPDPAERTAVPCILYGPTVLAGRACAPQQVGSHLDLVRTLIELAAPAGFSYHAWGHDLFGPQAGWSTGALTVVTPERWVDVSAGTSAAMGEVSAEEFAAFHQLSQAVRGLAWWRLFHGAALPPDR